MIEVKVKRQIDSEDNIESSAQIRHLFTIISEYKSLDRQYGFPKSIRYKEDRIPRYMKDLPQLKDLSVEKFLGKVKDRSIIEFLMLQLIMNPIFERFQKF